METMSHLSRPLLEAPSSTRQTGLGALKTLPPDPNFTFNIYADGLLDDLMLRVVLPFRRRLNMRNHHSLLWSVRYSRRGRHLKLRLHIDEQDRLWAEGLLGQMTLEYFSEIVEIPAPTERIHQKTIPVIDPVDALEGLAEDRSLIETRYERGFVNLGGEPFLSLDPYAAHMSRGLSAGLGFVLRAIEGFSGASLPWQASEPWRQKVLLQTLLVGVHATGWNEKQKCELKKYFEFHRDCLLRFYVSNLDQEQVTRDLFDQQVAKSPVAPLRALSEAEAQRSRELADTCSASLDATELWRRSVAELCSYLAQFSGDEGYLTHPFAENVAWPPVFKLFHGVANQLGVAPLKEAFVHHLSAHVLHSDDAAPSLEGGSQ